MSKLEVRGLLLAPLPLFLLACLMFVRPEFGRADVLIGVGSAFGVSYGIMAFIGMPVHFVMRKMKCTSINAYMGISIAAVWGLILIYALVAPSTPPVSAQDSSPFAGASDWDLIFSAFLIPIAGASAVFAATTAGLFWVVAIGQAGSRAEP